MPLLIASLLVAISTTPAHAQDRPTAQTMRLVEFPLKRAPAATVAQVLTQFFATRYLEQLCSHCEFYYRFEAEAARARGDSAVADSLLGRLARDARRTTRP